MKPLAPALFSPLVLLLTTSIFAPPSLALDPPPAADPAAEQVYKWLKEDPKCDHDDPMWKELRHMLTLPDDYIQANMYKEAEERLGPAFTAHSDWKRMYGAEMLDQSRGYFSKFVQFTLEPQPGTGEYVAGVSGSQISRCYLGVVTFFYYLARYKWFALLDLEAGFQVYRILESLVRQMPAGTISRFNNLSEKDAALTELSPIPADEDTYHWPITGQMIARQEQLFVSELGKERTILDEGTGTRVPIGNAYNVWPTDSLNPNTPTPDFANTWEVSAADGSSGSQNITLPTLQSSFKVFVYDTTPSSNAFMRSGGSYCRQLEQTGAEVDLHHWFLACPNCRTEDPNEADFFFVPQYSACEWEVLRADKEHEVSEAKFVEDFKQFVEDKELLPYFKRSNGRDHVFALTGKLASGFPLERIAKEVVSESILLFTEGGSHFSFSKDIMIPGRESLGLLVEQFALSRAPADVPIPSAMLRLDQDDALRFTWTGRPFVGASFAGAAGGRADSSAITEFGQTGLLEWMTTWEKAGKPTEGRESFGDMKIPEARPSDKAELLLETRKSQFCYLTNPPVDVSRSLFAGCIPIFIKNSFEIPYQQFLASKVNQLPLFSQMNVDGKTAQQKVAPVTESINWFVKWPEGKVTRDLATYSRQFTQKQAENMLKNLEKVRCWYVYPPSILSTDFMPARLKKMCPNWRTENALMGMHAVLAEKKSSVNKLAPNAFPLTNPRSGTVNLVDQGFNLIQRYYTMKQ